MKQWLARLESIIGFSLTMQENQLSMNVFYTIESKMEDGTWKFVLD